MRRARVLVVGCLMMVGGAAAAEQEAAPQEHVRGDVVGVSGDALKVKTRTGDSVTLALPENVPVAKAEKADLHAIRDGEFVGATAVPDRNGTLRAIEVHVFPESMRGVGEGSRPWDLQPGSSMTNATVAQSGPGSQPASTMTNATVDHVAQAGGGRKLELKYSGGEKTVVVPPGAKIVKLEPADRSGLKAGDHVFAIASRRPDGKLLAKRITVGEGGVVPPM